MIFFRCIRRYPNLHQMVFTLHSMISFEFYLESLLSIGILPKQSLLAMSGRTITENFNTKQQQRYGYCEEQLNEPKEYKDDQIYYVFNATP